MKKQPIRMCAACRERFPKAQLLRVALSEEGEAVLDKEQRVMGRGAYVCYNRRCVERAKKHRSLERALKVSVSGSVWEALVREADADQSREK